LPVADIDGNLVGQVDLNVVREQLRRPADRPETAQ
jgi:hypothetical protein